MSFFAHPMNKQLTSPKVGGVTLIIPLCNSKSDCSLDTLCKSVLCESDTLIYMILTCSTVSIRLYSHVYKLIMLHHNIKLLESIPIMYTYNNIINCYLISHWRRQYCH